MKKITLSFVSVLLLGTSLSADTSEKTFYEPNQSGVYIGLAYSSYSHDVSGIEFANGGNFSIDDRLPMFQVGYKYNPYISAEARYWLSVSNFNQSGGTNSGNKDGDLDGWGIYLKPTLPLNKKINLYALVGYGSTSISYDLNSWDTDGFSWGIGFDIEVVENLSFYMDYVDIASADDFDYTYTSGSNLSSIDANIDVTTLNIGLNYKFGF
jgi:opacity protein-like surface antigen